MSLIRGQCTVAKQLDPITSLIYSSRWLCVAITAASIYDVVVYRVDQKVTRDVLEQASFEDVKRPLVAHDLLT